jgi:hypothetical protein
MLIKRIAILEGRVRALENQIRVMSPRLNPIGFQVPSLGTNDKTTR